jgi:uncharacterized protein YjbJ (UPF0337 family)
MGAFKEQAKGVGQEIKGKVKEETGDLLDDDRMEVEGKAEKHVGRARQDMAQPMENARGAAREVKGNVKEGLGRATGNRDLEAEGRVERVSGNVKKNTRY